MKRTFFTKNKHFVEENPENSIEKMQKLNLRMQKLNLWRGMALIGAQKKTPGIPSMTSYVHQL